MGRPGALVLLAGLATGGCAKRTDAETRAAWQDSLHERTSGGGGSGAAGPGGAGGGSNGSSATGWARVDELLQRAADVMAASPEPRVLAQLAKEWCDVEPEPQTTPAGDVRVCYPKPPVSAEGHTFTLELGGEGVIGLVVSDLTNAESRALADRARKATANRCQGPWTPVPGGDPQEAGEEFQTCPVAGGPVLTVGRIPLPETKDLWQVSIAVLGAS